MTESLRRCFRCMGAKKMYEMNGGYSAVDMGGAKVDCPLCAGKGKIPKVAVSDIGAAKDTPPKTVLLTSHTESDVKEKLHAHEKVKKKMGRPKKNAEGL